MRWDEITRFAREVSMFIALLLTMYVLANHLRHPETPVCATPSTKDR